MNLFKLFNNPVRTKLPLGLELRALMQSFEIQYLAAHTPTKHLLIENANQQLTFLGKPKPALVLPVLTDWLIKKAKRLEKPIYITVKGKTEGILMSEDEYEGLIATLETLSDPEMMKGIREGEEDFKAGRVVSLEEVIAEMEQEKLLIADKGTKKYVSSRPVKKGSKKSKKA